MTRSILFKNQTHKDFYFEYLPLCTSQDGYHKALIYLLGISQDTRNNVERIYNFKSATVNPECLHEGWQTSGSRRIILLAFNLFCAGTPSVWDFDTPEKQLQECMNYAVDDIFCCEYAKYFWEAIKLRYPEYCLH